jgi:hypothetical protein
MAGANVPPPVFEDLSLRRASWFSRMAGELLDEGGNEADLFRLAAGFVEEKTARRLAVGAAESLDWSTRVLRHPEVLKELPVELYGTVQVTLLRPELSARYYLYALAMTQRAPVDTRSAWIEEFRRFVGRLNPGDEIEVFAEAEPEQVQPILERYILRFLRPEVRKFGGLREATPEVRDEIWACIVEGKDVEPLAEAPVVRPATVQED